MNQLRLLPPTNKKVKLKKNILQQYQKAINQKRQAQFLLVKLYQNYETYGIHYYLVDKLFYLSQKQFYFYAHQLIYLLLKRQSPPIQKLLIAKCKQNLSFFILIYWSVNAFGYPIKQRSNKDYQKVINLENLLMNSMITSTFIIQNKQIYGKQKTFIFSKQKAEQFRTRYYQTMKKFISKLVQLSAKLKTLPDQLRKSQLQSQIKMANKFLQKLRSNPINCQVIYTQGIIFPFFPLKSGAKSNLLVNIVNDNCSCFNTRKRVPYRIIMQTIDPQDLLNYKRQYRYGSQKQDTVQDFLDGQTEYYDDIQFERKKYEQGSNILLKMKQYIQKQQLIKQKQLQQKQKQKQKPTKKIRKQLQRKTTKYHHQFQSIPCISLLQRGETYKKNYQKFRIMHKSLHKRLSKSNSQGDLSISAQKQNIHKHCNRQDIRSAKGQQYVSKQLVNFIDQLALNGSKKLKKSLLNFKQELIVTNPILFQNDVQIDQKVKKLWSYKIKVIRSQSDWGKFPSYCARNIMVKGGDDLRQQILVMQLMNRFKKIWDDASIQLTLLPYQITLIDQSSGLLQFVSNSCSIDGLKKTKGFVSIKRYLQQMHQHKFDQARAKFIQSLAGYSIFSYLLQIKDRHNGNILMDLDGHIIHIDFGFIFNSSPGGLNFQNSPFKFTQQYLQVLDGQGSDLYTYFKYSILRGMLELQKHVQQIVTMVGIMQYESDLQCFKGFNLQQFKGRFRINANYNQMQEYVQDLLKQSCCNRRTIMYDHFQWYSNGIKQ